MKINRIAIAGVVLALGVGCLTSCSSESSSTTAPASSTTIEAPKPADLNGDWEQRDEGTDDTHYAATIVNDTVTVNYTGDVTGLFWQGSYEAPTEAGDYTWTSQGDTEAMSQSILASTDSTKDFTYSASDDELSFKIEWQGATAIIHMSRK
ncbi:MAG: hypothetical protein ACFN0W_12480 [Propionibacterium acidifaciens]|uniref:hypothetical protein n=1 Tax=Propionibacterium acidifaciens TaxID=556499 RepID=UPI003613E2E8